MSTMLQVIIFFYLRKQLTLKDILEKEAGLEWNVYLMVWCHSLARTSETHRAVLSPEEQINFSSFVSIVSYFLCIIILCGVNLKQNVQNGNYV